MKRKYLQFLVASLFASAAVAMAQGDMETEGQSTIAPQSWSPEEVAEMESLGRARGEFSNGKYTRTWISSAQFLDGDGRGLKYFGNGYRYRGASNTTSYSRAQLSLPQGALLCYIGLTYYDATTSYAIDVQLIEYPGYGDPLPNAVFRETVLSSDTPANDFGHASAMIDPYTIGVPPIVISLPRCRTINNDLFNGGAIYEFEAVLPVADSSLRFKAVDARWRRQIATAPATASFTDVPTTHTFFREIEALNASGITTGCGGTNFCPNTTLTRGQMAAFLSRALGLFHPED